MNKPIVWTVAGSDSGGGAGVQADIKVMNLLGVHACSVITALTAQNTIGTGRMHCIPSDMIEAQFEALSGDLPPAAVKIGMLATGITVDITARYLQQIRPAFSVCDPVLISSSGAFLLEAPAWDRLTRTLFPLVDLVTPNIPEAEHLLGLKINTPADVEAAARKALDLGVKEVLIKGGHDRGNSELARDCWSNGHRTRWFSSPRIETRSQHGTGCFLSSAIAAARARGCPPEESIVAAKAFLNQGLRQAPELGRGYGPLAFNPPEFMPDDLPLVAERPDDPGVRAERPAL